MTGTLYLCGCDVGQNQQYLQQVANTAQVPVIAYTGDVYWPQNYVPWGLAPVFVPTGNTVVVQPQLQNPATQQPANPPQPTNPPQPINPP